VIAAGAAVSVEGVAAGEGAVIGRAAARPVAAPGGAAAGEGRGCQREGWSLLVRARAVEATERRGWVGEVPAPLPRLSTGRPRASNGHGGGCPATHPAPAAREDTEPPLHLPAAARKEAPARGLAPDGSRSAPMREEVRNQAGRVTTATGTPEGPGRSKALGLPDRLSHARRARSVRY
jgi:hypothetical protein